MPLLAGSAVALCFFAGLGGWAATAPLAGAAIAPAVVAPDGSRKTVQHLEGGIVRRILVQDGSKVVAGQELIELDDTAARAEHAALLAQCQALLAAEARLMAEQAGAPTATFPDDLLRRGPRRSGAWPGCSPARADRLASRRAALADQQAVLAERITQGEAEISGLEAQIASGQRQLELIAEEAEGVAEPARQGPGAEAAPAGASSAARPRSRAVSRAGRAGIARAGR